MFRFYCNSPNLLLGIFWPAQHEDCLNSRIVLELSDDNGDNDYNDDDGYAAADDDDDDFDDDDNNDDDD